ncbi:MAG: amidase [Methylocella sp.]
MSPNLSDKTTPQGGHDRFGAFMPIDVEALPRQASEGPLCGLGCAVKDLFDIAGLVTTAGQPQWAADHPIPERSATAVERVLAAGAKLVGKTVTDELAWSLNGENAHYGAPINPNAPGRITGGSSAGSAAAVAGNLADFALGTDTGGSVRLPASFCGIWGMRPTHGRISVEGVVPLAPSFDAVGWFASDAVTLRDVGMVLLNGVRNAAVPPRRMFIATDAFANAGAQVEEALKASLDFLRARFSFVEVVAIGPDSLDAWRTCFTILQAGEAWAAHGAWIIKAQPDLGVGVRERFQAASRIDAATLASAAAVRRLIRERMDYLLGDDAFLVLPTAPGIAPLRGEREKEREEFRRRALNGLCPAGLAGLPQIAMPLGEMQGCPLGLSIIAPRFQDERLLTFAMTLEGLS